MERGHAVGQTVGWAAHQRAVDALRASYDAIPAGDTVRLAKKTSILFRPRAEVRGGLDVSGLSGVIEVDPGGRTAEVQGMCTYEDLVDATLPHGLMPFVVPQLRMASVAGTEALKNFLKEDNCLGFLPRRALLKELRDGELVAVKIDKLRITRDFHFIQRQGSENDGLNKAFIKFAKLHVPVGTAGR